MLHSLGSNFLRKFSKSNTNNTSYREKPGEAAARAPTGTQRSHSLLHPPVLLEGLTVTPGSLKARGSSIGILGTAQNSGGSIEHRLWEILTKTPKHPPGGFNNPLWEQATSSSPLSCFSQSVAEPRLPGCSQHFRSTPIGRDKNHPAKNPPSLFISPASAFQKLKLFIHSKASQEPRWPLHLGALLLISPRFEMQNSALPSEMQEFAGSDLH